MKSLKGLSPATEALVLVGFSLFMVSAISQVDPQLVYEMTEEEKPIDQLGDKRPGLDIGSAVYTSNTESTSVLIRNSGEIELTNFTVTAEVNGTEFNKRVSETISPSEVINVEIRTFKSPSLVKVNSEQIEISDEETSIRTSITYREAEAGHGHNI